MFADAQRSWVEECKFFFAALRVAVTSRGSETGATGRSRTITSDAYELGPHSRQQEADDGIDVIADSAAILAGVPPPLSQTVSNGLGGNNFNGFIDRSRQLPESTEGDIHANANDSAHTVSLVQRGMSLEPGATFH